MDKTKYQRHIRSRIGLYSIGLNTYWNQFNGLKDRIIGYNKFNVDLIFCHAATYATSSTVLPIHSICKAKVVVLNLQPTAQINYQTATTGEWLAHCSSCVVPEIANVFRRNRIPFHMVSGLLGLHETPEISLTDEVTYHRAEAIDAWKQIKEWIKAGSVKRTLQNSRFGFLGNTYSGMLDMYSDFTQISGQTHSHLQILEMCDLAKHIESITELEIANKIIEIEDMFWISEDSPSDPIAKKPTKDQIRWSAIVAVAQEKLIEEYNLNGLAYYYHGTKESDYEKIQGGFIVGNSLLTSKGIPCSGEGDLKTLVAMKICDILGIGGSFSELVVIDYDYETILVGHDGPFHAEISNGKPILRGMGLYHGKQGTGVSVEAKVKTGPVTTLNITQTDDYKLKMIVCEAMSVDGPKMVQRISNTSFCIGDWSSCRTDKKSFDSFRF